MLTLNRKVELQEGIVRGLLSAIVRAIVRRVVSWAFEKFIMLRLCRFLDSDAFRMLAHGLTHDVSALTHLIGCDEVARDMLVLGLEGTGGSTLG